MMHYFRHTFLLPVFILALLLLEGLGLDRQIIFILSVMVPSIAVMVLFLRKDKLQRIRLPRHVGAIMALFLISSVISAVLSPNMQRAFEYTAYLSAVFLIAILFYNTDKEKTMKLLFHGILFLGLFFSVISVVLTYVIPESWIFLVPNHPYQYIFDPFDAHNPLGIFLIVPLALLLPSWSTSNSLKERVLFMFFFLCLLISYARAAYVTMALITLLYIGLEVFIQKKKIPRYVITTLGMVIIFSTLLFIAVVWFENGPSWYVSLHNHIVQTFNFPQYKSFISARDQYALQAFKGFLERPWFGWGPDNLMYASFKHLPIMLFMTTVSENLILDILAEHGLIGSVFFFSLVGLLFFQGWRSVITSDSVLQKRFFLAFTAILIMMMGNTLKQNYVYFMFFFVIGILLYREQRHVILSPRSFTLISLLVVLFIFLKINSQFLLALGFPEAAQLVYPLNTSVYPVLIEKAFQEQNRQYMMRWSDVYVGIFPGDQSALVTAGNTHMAIEREKALNFYTKAYEAYPLRDFNIVKSIYYLKNEVEGAESANTFLLSHIDRFLASKRWAMDRNFPYVSQEGHIYHFCQEVGVGCEEQIVRTEK